MKRLLPLLALTILMGASAATAQNRNITAPDGDWDVPTSAKKGDQVTIRYTGTNKFVKNVKIVPLPTTVTITPSCHFSYMEIGEEATLQADIYPNLDAVDKTVTWKLIT